MYLLYRMGPSDRFCYINGFIFLTWQHEVIFLEHSRQINLDIGEFFEWIFAIQILSHAPLLLRKIILHPYLINDKI